MSPNPEGAAPETSPASPRRGLRDRTTAVSVFLLALVVVGLTVVELSVLDRRALANDEATSYFIAHVGWSDFWESLVTSEANGSAFYLLLRFWLEVGRSEAVLRVLPMLFAITTVPVLFAATRRMFGAPADVIAAAFLATNVMFLEHGQDLRSYSLSALLVTVSGWFFVRGLADPSIVNRVGHIVASALAMYAHFFSALVLLAQFVAMLLFPDRRRSLRFALPNFALVGVLVAPLAAFVMAGDRGQVDWIPKLSPRRVRGALVDLSGMPGIEELIVVVVVVMAGIAFALWRRPPDPAPAPARDVDENSAFAAPGWRVGFACLWVILPISGALLISFFKPLFVSRYLLVALPGLALTMAVAFASLPRRVLTAAATAAVIFLAVLQARDWYPNKPEGGYADRVAFIRDHARPDDAIAFYAPTIIRPFGYYAGYYTEGKTLSPDVLYPDKNWLGYSRTRFTPPLKRIAADAGRYARVWLVAGAARDRPRVVERQKLVIALRETCTTFDQPDVGIRLFTGCDS